jgi:hypothetical protein
MAPTRRHRVGVIPSPLFYLKTEAVTFRNIVFKCKKHWTMVKVQKQDSSKCITPSSKPFRITEFSVPWLHSCLKKKVKQSRYTPWRRLGGEGYISNSFLTLTLDGGEWSASRPGRALALEKGPLVPIVGGWVGLRAGLDTGVTGKILCPCRESNLDRKVVQPVVRHYTAWATPASPS